MMISILQKRPMFTGLFSKSNFISIRVPSMIRSLVQKRPMFVGLFPRSPICRSVDAKQIRIYRKLTPSQCVSNLQDAQSVDAKQIPNLWMRSKFTSARSAHWNLQISTHSHVVCHVQITPHQKLLRDGVLTPVPLFSLICTIISNKTGIFEQYQNTPQVLAARSFLAAGFDTLVILRSFSCILQTYSPLQIVTISTYSHLQMPYSGMYLFAQETHVRRVLLQQQIQIYYYSHLQIVRIRQTQKQCYTYASA